MSVSPVDSPFMISPLIFSFPDINNLTKSIRVLRCGIDLADSLLCLRLPRDQLPEVLVRQGQCDYRAVVSGCWVNEDDSADANSLADADYSTIRLLACGCLALRNLALLF